MREVGALLEGHFKLSSGRHSDRYFQCARLLQYPGLAMDVGRLLAEQFNELELDAFFMLLTVAAIAAEPVNTSYISYPPGQQGDPVCQLFLVTDGEPTADLELEAPDQVLRAGARDARRCAHRSAASPAGAAGAGSPGAGSPGEGAGAAPSSGAVDAVAGELRSFTEGVEYDPEELEQLNQRLALLGAACKSDNGSSPRSFAPRVTTRSSSS